jgi:predicted nucleic acid-binding protein
MDTNTTLTFIDTLTPARIQRLEQDWSNNIAYEPIQIHVVTGKIYAIGSELAVRRLAHEFKSFSVGCSAFLAREYGSGWYYGHEPKL